MGDVRRGGVYSGYQADLVTRMPKKELRAVLIKQQHNVSSNGADYPLRLLDHARVVVLWRKRARPQWRHRGRLSHQLALGLGL
jgi:hypothetical protein